MFAAYTPAGEDTLLTTLLGFGLLLLFSGTLLALHVRRWRERGIAPRLRRAAGRLHDGIASRPPPGAQVSPAAPPTGRTPHAGADDESGGATGPQSTTMSGASACAPGPPALPGVRHSPETLEPLGGRLDRSRRLAVCDARVAEVLARLPRDRWLVERYVLIKGNRIPFVVVGETGVFTIWPLDRVAGYQDLALFDELAGAVQRELPGYTGTVQAGACQALDPSKQPQWTYSPEKRAGGWMMGLDWLIAWLEHFGTEHGLAVKDVERLDELAGPRWERRPRSVRVPARPPIG
ncbi:MAG: hypothetical protein ACRDPC_19500 [Solirubrobacteraceae bacterium]